MYLPSDVVKSGGKWLGAVRTRIQTMFSNGDSVTWSSTDELKPGCTVKHIEELAAVAVAADRNERDKNEIRIVNALREMVKQAESLSSWNKKGVAYYNAKSIVDSLENEYV